MTFSRFLLAVVAPLALLFAGVIVFTNIMFSISVGLTIGYLLWKGLTRL